MSYVHDNKKPAILRNDPVDPESIDWIYFSYGNWLRDDETISEHAGFVIGGEVVIDSTYLGTLKDSNDVEFTEVYGVQFSVDEGASSVTITHRVSTTTTGAIDLGRLDIDHSAVLSVKTL
jgi:hypothetical protein